MWGRCSPPVSPPAVPLRERATGRRRPVGKEGAQLPRGDIPLLARGRCKAPQMYTLRLGYFGQGPGRSCDWSWGLQVWAAGSCLSDSDSLPDPGNPRAPLCWGRLSHPFPACFVVMKTQRGAGMWLRTTRESGDRDKVWVGICPLTPWHSRGWVTRGPQGCPRGDPHFFTAVPPPAPALCPGQSSPGAADPQPGAGSRWRRRLSADPVSPGLSSLNASNACQKYLCGTWKVNFSFPFFNSGGAGRVTGCEKGRWGGCASLASEWAGRGVEQKVSLLPDFSTL